MVSQLIKISSTKAQISIKTTPAQVKLRTTPPQLKITRQRNGLSIKTQRSQIQISSRAMRQSIMTMKGTLQLMNEYAQKGLEAAQEATRRYVEIGNQMADIAHNVTVPQIYKSSFIPNIETAMTFIPQTGPDITFTPASVEINYTPDDLNFDWLITPVEGEYIPYNVDTSLAVKPDVEIEYIGSPVYFPPNNANVLQEQKAQFEKDSKF